VHYDANQQIKGGDWILVKVKKRDNESFSQLMRRFRKKVTRSKVLSEHRKRRFFTSKSEERRIAKKKAIRKMRQHNRDFR
jgi:small subunit ribosomal protein S21